MLVSIVSTPCGAYRVLVFLLYTAFLFSLPFTKEADDWASKSAARLEVETPLTPKVSPPTILL